MEDIDDNFIDEYENDDYDDEVDNIKSENESDNDELLLDEEVDIDYDNDSDNSDHKYNQVVEKKIESKMKSRNIIIVPSHERVTDNKLHKSEVSFLLSTRAKQISKHATHFVENYIGTNAMTIAYKELYTHRCPLKLRRQIGVTVKGDILMEEWDVKQMVLPKIDEL
jgi:DNA-directed RNA polymerase subunit K/omega